MDEMMFEGVQYERVYEKIVHQIRQLLQEGKLKPGDRLPSERELASSLGCSRTSLREAFRVLESEGIVISKPGGGRFIQHVENSLRLKYQFNPVDLIQKSSIFYFLEAREALEPRIAELACKRATNENLKKMEQILINMEEKFKTPDENVDWDSSFHLSLAEATQNFVFVSMMKTNLNMVRQIRKKTLTSKVRYFESLKEHRLIFEAIKQRDVAQAIDFIKIHLKNLRENIITN